MTQESSPEHSYWPYFSITISFSGSEVEVIRPVLKHPYSLFLHPWWDWMPLPFFNVGLEMLPTLANGMWMEEVTMARVTMAPEWLWWAEPLPTHKSLWSLTEEKTCCIKILRFGACWLPQIHLAYPHWYIWSAQWLLPAHKRSLDFFSSISDLL